MTKVQSTLQQVSDSTMTKTTAPLLKYGSSGDSVKELQKWLKDHDLYGDFKGKELPIDGLFGSYTKLAVIKLQESSGIKVDGNVGNDTRKLMEKISTPGPIIVQPRYQGERYNPTLSLLSITLNFDGKFLTMLGRYKTYTYYAVAGKSVDGKWFYNTDRQKMDGIGPLPEGLYWIRPDEMWTNKWYSPRKKSSWGNHAIAIHPFTTTDTFGRGGFTIHGGDTPGSAGCIDLTTSMDQFVKDLLFEVGDTPKCQIHLKVKYDRKLKY